MLFNCGGTAACIVGSGLFNCIGTSSLKCVIQLQWNISVGNVLFKYRGTSALVVCYSIAVEQQSSTFVIRLQLNISGGSALFNGSGTAAFIECYSILVD